MLADWEKDLSEISADFPSVLVFGSSTLNVTRSDYRDEMMIEPGGDYDPRTVDVLAVYSQFETIPETSQTVTLDDVKFYVDSIDPDPLTDSVRMSLKRHK